MKVSFIVIQAISLGVAGLVTAKKLDGNILGNQWNQARSASFIRWPQYWKG
jgi:hypothetical protein